MRLTKSFYDFFKSERTAGLLLVSCTVISLIVANSTAGEGYVSFWQRQAAGHSFEYWINDGLMTIFFLLIGLELEREIYKGELSSFRNAALPAMSALGGMLVPAGIYLYFNYGLPSQRGVGIPTATDIAFAIGILSLLGNRIPLSLKIFLTALAVIDDLGAIIIIAIFYAHKISLLYMAGVAVVYGILLILRKYKVNNLISYIIGGFVMWYFMVHSGIHPSITGVLLALVIPFGDGEKESSSHRLQNVLNKPVAFIILPLFALANTCLIINHNWQQSLMQPASLGILAGLVIGKPLGIFLFGFLGVKLGICKLPANTTWRQLTSIGILGGIGFTMSIFITLLAFTNPSQADEVKVAIILSSFIAGFIGLLWLRMTFQSKEV